MKKLALLGASGHGKVIADAARVSGWQSVSFFDDAWKESKNNGCWEVVGATTDLLCRLSEFDGVIVSIGNVKSRWGKHVQLKEAGARMVSIVHPSAVISPSARIGIGTAIMAGAIVNADAAIGESCIINTGASVDHDCILENGVHVCPGAHLSGGVSVGFGSWIGVGAAVRQSIKIGSSVMAGAGAVVVNNISDGQIVFGNPAKVSIHIKS